MVADRLKGVGLGTDRAGWRIRASEVDRVLQPERPADETRQQRLPIREQRSPKLAAA
jgi:hypothetical protein